ncbi:MAG: hypothetical protein JXR05_02300 [Flavobacteriaceae bacterium]
MKNRFVRVTVVTIVISFFYFTFFTEKAEDVSNNKNNLTPKVENIFVEPDTIFNEKGYLVIAKPNSVKIISTADTINYKEFQKIATYKNEIVLIEEIDSGYIEVYKKKNFKELFEEHKVSLYIGELADPDFTSNSDAKTFVTRITDGCKEGVNFAGHYTLIYWGCGSSCQYGVIVDRKTGKIYDGYQTSLGSSFKADSKLILKNSGLMDDNSNYFLINHSYAKLGLEVWEKNKFTLID